VTFPQLFANRPMPLSMDQASDIAAGFGICGKLSPLESERDQNIRIEVPDGPGYVLKITNPEEPPSVTAFETYVLEHLAVTAAHLPVPRLVRTLDGALAVRWPAIGGERTVRLLTFLSGTPLVKASATPTLRASIGYTLAALDAALRPVSPQTQSRCLLWDFGQVLQLRSLLPTCANSALRTRLELAFDRLDAERISCRTDMRPQWLHNDFNPYNVLVSSANMAKVTGIVDFGDMAYGPLVCDLAVACAYSLHRAAPFDSMADVIEGFNIHTPLSAVELNLLPLLIEVRFAMTVLITQWRAALNPNNRAYILRNSPGALAGLAAIGEESASAVSALFQRRLCKGTAFR